MLYSLLEGTLPFHDATNKGLFKLIENASYSIVRTISEEAKDLINRMLQPDTLKRISIAEIKEHPWFQKDLDNYLFDPRISCLDQSQKKLNEEVYAQVKSLIPELVGK